MKRRAIVGLLVVLFLTLAGPSHGGATTVVSVSPFVPHMATPPVPTFVDIGFHTDPAVGIITVTLFGMHGPVSQEAEIATYSIPCGSVNPGFQSILIFNDQGCIRGQIDIEQHLGVGVICWVPGTYSIRVEAAHVPAQSSESFVCTWNPLHTGPIPPISGDVPNWLSLLLRPVGSPVGAPNGVVQVPAPTVAPPPTVLPTAPSP
jgi:hypothetical protein